MMSEKEKRKTGRKGRERKGKEYRTGRSKKKKEKSETLMMITKEDKIQ